MFIVIYQQYKPQPYCAIQEMHKKYKEINFKHKSRQLLQELKHTNILQKQSIIEKILHRQ